MSRVRYGLIAASLAFALALTSSVAFAEDEMRVRWSPGALGEDPPVSLVERRRKPGAPQRQRNPELTADQLVVVALDRHGEEIDRQIVANPLIVRAEAAEVVGELEHRTVTLPSADFLLSWPDEAAIHRLDLFQPVWDGTTFVLVPIGSVDLR